MSIEQKIEELTEAVKVLTAAIKEAGKNVDVHGDTVAKPEPDAQIVPPAPAAAPPTIDEVNAALVAKAQQIGAEGAAKIRGMLQEKFGVTGISQIPTERLGEVLIATEALT